jgi:hypothetical protein
MSSASKLGSLSEASAVSGLGVSGWAGLRREGLGGGASGWPEGSSESGKRGNCCSASPPPGGSESKRGSEWSSEESSVSMGISSSFGNCGSSTAGSRGAAWPGWPDVGGAGSGALAVPAAWPTGAASSGLDFSGGLGDAGTETLARPPSEFSPAGVDLGGLGGGRSLGAPELGGALALLPPASSGAVCAPPSLLAGWGGGFTLWRASSSASVRGPGSLVGRWSAPPGFTASPSCSRFGAGLGRGGVEILTGLEPKVGRFDSRGLGGGPLRRPGELPACSGPVSPVAPSSTG